MSELNVCLINDSFPPEIDGVANAVTNYAEIISSRHGRTTVVTPDNPEADDSVYGFPVLRYPSRLSLLPGSTEKAGGGGLRYYPQPLPDQLHSACAFPAGQDQRAGGHDLPHQV